MGFSTGFVGGLTLTYSMLYLSIHLHRLNRQQQHHMLLQQNTILNSLIEPLPALPEQPAFAVRKESMGEMFKDRWNREVEDTVRGIQNTDWNSVRERWEARVSDVWRRVKN